MRRTRDEWIATDAWTKLIAATFRAKPVDLQFAHHAIKPQPMSDFSFRDRRICRVEIPLAGSLSGIDLKRRDPIQWDQPTSIGVA